MPSPQSGNAPNAVSPAAPKEAVEADKANPGEVTKAKGAEGQSGTGGGGGGAGSSKPHNPTEEDKKTKKSWIEIVLVDMENKPVPGEPYRVTLPDNSVAEGTLDEKGFARVEAFDAGNCKITFPNRDQSVWSPK
jgi:type VI secretion system secreted protein VgrG